MSQTPSSELPTRRWKSPAPIDFAASVARYTRWGVDLATVVEDGALYRVSSRRKPYRVRALDATTIELAGHGDLQTAEAEVRHRLADQLSRDDVVALGERVPEIARQLDRLPGYRPPMGNNVLEALVGSICAQQVNLTWAATTKARLVERYGTAHALGGVIVHAFPEPKVLAAADPADIRAMQFTTRKAEYVVEAARAVAEGELDDLDRLPDDDVIARITAIRGLGRWTAEWFLARTLARPHAVAPGDLGVRKAVSRFVASSDETLPESDVRAICADWGDGANWGMHLLLEALSADGSV